MSYLSQDGIYFSLETQQSGVSNQALRQRRQKERKSHQEVWVNVFLLDVATYIRKEQ